ncbi:MAG TPA: FAD-binding oxidoreductase [Salinarimonas sp.]|nr:FAD-binding oxidoreductase [Salinarimonas sp.]
MNPCVSALLAALGPDRVRVGADIPVRNHADQGGRAPTPPLALVLPRSTEEVSSTLRICHEHGQPVVTQGGMTGLAGGAHPGEGEVALSLERLSGVEEVDAASGTLTALAGTPLAVVQKAAEEAGYLCGIDLGARGSCTIGGNIATNAGGNQVLRYGMARKNVLGLEVVLADGRIVRSLNKMLKNNAGYDWTQLFIGSEGTLGVVTRVVLGLHPRPQGVESVLCGVENVEAALALLRRIERRFPGRLLVFEGMWREFMEVATGPGGLARPFDEAHDLCLLIEAAMGDGGADAFAGFLAEAYEEGLVRDALVARSEADRARFWAYRESPYEYRRYLPKEIGFDVSIPLDRMDAAIAAFRERIPARFPDAIHVAFGHIADSNVHVTVAKPGLDEATYRAIEETVYGVVQELGGSISAEHGIGRNKRPYLQISRTEAELALMATIKAALDPAGLLNPGRVL